MLIHSNRFPGLPFKHRHVLPSISMLSSLTIPSPTNHTSSESVDETFHRISTLTEQPNWERIRQLKSLVSHMNPQAAFEVIALQSSNVELGVRFFKWVCKQSTYCYELDSRIHLLSLMLSHNLFGIVHKVVVVVIRECCMHEHHVLKLMGALDDLRNIGCRLNYPCYLLARLAKLNMGLSSCSVYRRMVDDAVIHCATGIPWSTFEPNLSANGKVTDITPGVSAMWTFALKKLTFSKKPLVPLLLIPKGRNLEYLVKLISEGKLKTVVDSKHPLRKAEDAWAKSIDGHATGKIVVEP